MRNPWRLTGRKVLVGLIAFFGIVAAVNGVFIYFALASWPGLSSTEAYKDGLNYNDVLDDARRQDALGWRSEIDMNRAGEMTFRIVNQSGAPVNGLSVEAIVERPVGSEREIRTALSQALDGSYRGAAEIPAPGQWRVQIAAARNDGTHYRMTYDVMVKP